MDHKVGRGNWRKYLDLSLPERAFFLEAMVFHLWVGLVLKVIPFRRIPRLFSSPQFDAPTQEEAQSRNNVTGRYSDTFELIRGAIQRAGTVSPWKNKCLVSSLAGRCMLRRREISSMISLGVAKDAGGKVIAHAWLRTGNIDIVPAAGSFHELYQF